MGSGEWGVGSGEWYLFPTPHSPLPTPHSPSLDGGFINAQRAAVGVERRCYAERQGQVAVRAVAAGQSEHYRDIQIGRAFGQNVLDSVALIGVLIAIGHLAEDYPANFVEFSGQSQLLQHPVDRVRPRGGVFQEEYRASRVEFVGRSHHRCNQRQTSAEQTSGYASSR